MKGIMFLIIIAIAFSSIFLITTAIEFSVSIIRSYKKRYLNNFLRKKNINETKTNGKLGFWYKKKVKTVENLSATIVRLKGINNFYNFNYINGKLFLYASLDTKKRLENYDLQSNLVLHFRENLTYYNELFNKAKSDDDNYIQYTDKLESLKFTEKNEFLEIKQKNNIRFGYKKFLKIEKYLWSIIKYLKPCTEINCEFNANYTTPAGRNTYNKNKTFDHEELYQVLLIANMPDPYKLERERKEKLQQEKREKERRLRELDKIEKRIAEKEEKLNRKEEEFLAATKGHIYSTEVDIKDDKKEVISEEDSPYVKLKKLKVIFDNGEINFEEYSKRKNEII